jgi:hypothetical protein
MNEMGCVNLKHHERRSALLKDSENSRGWFVEVHEFFIFGELNFEHSVSTHFHGAVLPWFASCAMQPRL